MYNAWGYKIAKHMEVKADEASDLADETVKHFTSALDHHEATTEDRDAFRAGVLTALLEASTVQLLIDVPQRAVQITPRRARRARQTPEPIQPYLPGVDPWYVLRERIASGKDVLIIGL